MAQVMEQQRVWTKCGIKVKPKFLENHEISCEKCRRMK